MRCGESNGRASVSLSLNFLMYDGDGSKKMRSPELAFARTGQSTVRRTIRRVYVEFSGQTQRLCLSDLLAACSVDPPCDRPAARPCISPNHKTPFPTQASTSPDLGATTCPAPSNLLPLRRENLALLRSTTRYSSSCALVPPIQASRRRSCHPFEPSPNPCSSPPASQAYTHLLRRV